MRGKVGGEQVAFWQLSVFILSYSQRLFSETPFASLCAPTRRLTMELRNGIHTLDAYRPTFDPHLDIATVVFSHVQCVKTRHSLALVSKLWRDASKPAAAYPLEFDFDAFPDMVAGSGFSALMTRSIRVIGLLDNDEALSLPYERVVGLLGETAKDVCEYSARWGSVRLLKWERENKLDWSEQTCHHAALNGHLPALQYLHENGCPWDKYTCAYAVTKGHLPALQYLHENGCPWDGYTCYYAAHKNTGTACSTRWITSARSGSITPRGTRITSQMKCRLPKILATYVSKPSTFPTSGPTHLNDHVINNQNSIPGVPPASASACSRASLAAARRALTSSGSSPTIPRLCVRTLRSCTKYFSPSRARSSYPAHSAKWCMTMDAATDTFKDAVPGPCCRMYTNPSHMAFWFSVMPSPCK